MVHRVSLAHKGQWVHPELKESRDLAEWLALTECLACMVVMDSQEVLAKWVPQENQAEMEEQEAQDKKATMANQQLELKVPKEISDQSEMLGTKGTMEKTAVSGLQERKAPMEPPDCKAVQANRVKTVTQETTDPPAKMPNIVLARNALENRVSIGVLVYFVILNRQTFFKESVFN